MPGAARTRDAQQTLCEEHDFLGLCRLTVGEVWLIGALPLQLKLQSALTDAAAQQGLEVAAIIRPHGEEIQSAILDTELLSQNVKAGVDAEWRQRVLC